MKEGAGIIGMALIFIGSYFFDQWKKKREKKLEEKNRPAVLDASAKIREKIVEYITKIQAYTGCSRAALFEYSNGNYTHSNISLQFIECTYEATDESTAPIINIFKREPIAPYLKIINIINESKTSWSRITDTEPDPSINKIQRYWRTSTSYNFRITDSVWDGVVGLSWINKEAELSPEQITNVEIMIMRIYNLMSQLVKK